MGTKLVEIFDTELGYIMDADLKQKTIALLTDLDDNVITVPSSITGKYHPTHDQGDGGVIRHCKAVCAAARVALSSYPEIDSDTFTIAAFVHDLCKTLKDTDDHPTKIAKACRAHGLDIVADLVACHMGKWNIGRHPECEMPIPETFEQKVLHLCDNIVSKPFVNCYFNGWNIETKRVDHSFQLSSEFVCNPVNDSATQNSDQSDQPSTVQEPMPQGLSQLS